MKKYRSASLLAATLLRYSRQVIVLGVISQQFGPSDASQYALALAITAPVFVLGSLGIRSVYISLQAHYAKVHFAKALGFTVTGAAVVVALIGIGIGGGFLPILLLVLVSKILDVFWELTAAYNIAGGEYRRIAVDSLLTLVSTGASVLIALRFFGESTSLHVLAGSIAAQAIVLFGISFPSAFRLKPIYSNIAQEAGHRPLRNILRAGIAIGAANALITLNSTVPQYVLGAARGDLVAHYAILTYVYVVVEMGLNSLTQVWQADIARSSRTKLEKYHIALHRVARTSLLLVPLGLVIILGASHVFPILFGSFATINIPQGIALLGIIVCLPVIFFLSRLLTILFEYRIQVPIAVASVLAGGLLSVPMITSWGLTGALFGFLSAMAIRSILLLTAVSRAARK